MLRLFWKWRTVRLISCTSSVSFLFCFAVSSSVLCNLACFSSGLTLLLRGVDTALSAGGEPPSESSTSAGSGPFLLHLEKLLGTVERRLCSADSKHTESPIVSASLQDPVERRFAINLMLSFRLCLCSFASRSRFSYGDTQQQNSK